MKVDGWVEVALSVIVSAALLYGGATELRRRAPQLRTNPLAWFAPLILISLGARGLAVAVHLLSNGAERTDFEFTIGPNVVAVVLIVGYALTRLYYVRALAIDIGTGDFPDQVEAARRAVVLQDHVIQELVTARWSLETNDPEQALEAIRRASDQTQKLVTEKMTAGRCPRIRPTTAGTGGVPGGG